MKIVSIIGARPQFVKAGVVSKQLRKHFNEILVHTGQHYDNNMSEVFFNELSIPKPDYNLAAGSGSHATQTAKILTGIEELLLNEKPDAIIVYGDTNSTLAGALAASKLLIPIIHIEAGLRSFNKAMPEEQNRVLTDHLSTILFCPTKTAVQNLKNENITNNVFDVGDVMCDAVLQYKKNLEKLTAIQVQSSFETAFGKSFNNVDKWYITTLHRAENTNDINTLKDVLSAFESFDYPVIFPVHPRISGYVKKLTEEKEYNNVWFIKPVGYSQMLFLVNFAQKVVTDSGGLQKEAYILETPCITMRDQTEWVETLHDNRNILCKPTKEDILDKAFNCKVNDKVLSLYGDGTASEKIANIIKDILS